MQIFAFLKPDGTYGADYSREFAARSGQIVAEFKATTGEQIKGVIANPGSHSPARVRALAERALSELQGRALPPVDAPVPQSVRERNLWRRLRWVFTGK